MKLEEIEKQKIARAVTATLTAVTSPAPNFLVSLSLWRLEIIVQNAIMNEMIPAYDTGTPNAGYMLGHAEPRRASGRPRETNEI